MALNDYLMSGRNAIFRYLVETGNVPSVNELAADLSLPIPTTKQLLNDLHNERVLFLGNDGNIQMLWPFSGVPTVFKVIANNISYWANCAFDAVAIPAALNTDAVISAQFAYPSQDPVTICVKDGKISPGEHLVNMPLPVREWYKDIVYT